MSSPRFAVPELAVVEVKGMTRSSFVVRGALAASAAYGAAAAGPFVERALAQDGQEQAAQGDLDILNFALTLEILEATFYEQALSEVSGLSGELRALTEEIRRNEVEHVSVLTTMVGSLGGEPVENVRLDFGDAFSDVQSYLELAQSFEDTGVGAYNGAGKLLQDKSILSAAGTIVQIEGRHAALIRMQRGEEIAPEAFDELLTMEQVLDRIEPFIRS